MTPEPVPCEGLKELAEKATPGPWSYEPDDDGSSMGWIVSSSEMLVKITGDSAQQGDNAAYIAAASPDVILALLSERSRLMEATLYIEKNTAKLGDDGKWRERLSQLGGACSRAAIFSPQTPVTINIPADLALDLVRAELALKDAEAARLAAEAALEQAKGALEPFAIEIHSDHTDGEPVRVYFSARDIRRAVSVLSVLGDGKGAE